MRIFTNCTLQVPGKGNPPLSVRGFLSHPNIGPTLPDILLFSKEAKHPDYRAKCPRIEMLAIHSVNL